MKEKNKFKIKRIFKSRIFFFVLGAFIFGMLGVGATTLLYSKDVTYDNSSSGLSSTNLQDALDELYAKAKNAPECDSNGNCTITCPIGTFYVQTAIGYVCSNTSVTIEKLGEIVVTNGSGLYADSTENGRYIYRGPSPSNYIVFNGETWRIMSVERDGSLKIIRNEQLSSTQYWDVNGTRNSSLNTYCSPNYLMCNAWSATSNLIGTPSEFTQYYPYGNSSNYSASYSGTVTQNSTLNGYLNSIYYISLTSTSKTKVVAGVFNVSTPGDRTDTETLDLDAGQEKQYQWKGYVALMTATELLKASTSTGCTNLRAGYNSGSSSTCKSNNWLWPTFNTNSSEWTLSPFIDGNRFSLWRVCSGGYIDFSGSNYAYGVRPVIHLSPSVTLSGSGTSSDPYTIN